MSGSSRFRARLEPGAEALELRVLESADESDGAGLRRHGGGRANEKRTLVLGELDRGRAGHGDVDVRERRVGEQPDEPLPSARRPRSGSTR